MKNITLMLVLLAAALGAGAAEDNAVEALVGREFVIEDDFAGQSFVLVRTGDGLRARWRVLGSGVPVVSEQDCPVDVRSPTLCSFAVRLRNARDLPRSPADELKVDLGGGREIRVYLNGVRIHAREWAAPAARSAPVPVRR